MLKNLLLGSKVRVDPVEVAAEDRTDGGAWELIGVAAHEGVDRLGAGSLLVAQLHEWVVPNTNGRVQENTTGSIVDCRPGRSREADVVQPPDGAVRGVCPADKGVVRREGRTVEADTERPA